LQKIGEKYGILLSYYGHAGDGELHIRPWLDLSTEADVAKMRAIAEDVFSLAWSLGGTISGEHADGLVRAAFLERQYGKEYYNLLCLIKELFDPAGIMNPGKKITSDRDIMVKNLKAQPRYLTERLANPLLLQADELKLEIEQCSGCGVCLSTEAGQRMCPVFRALGEEMASSRAKANILGFWATGGVTEDCFQSEEFRRFLDLCINCKACSLQCPSGVDISKLMAAARAKYAAKKGLRRGEKFLSESAQLSGLGSVFSPVSNFVINLGISRWFLEVLAGFDRQRKMPRFEGGSFLERGREYLAGAGPIEKPIDKVAYFVDTFANYNDHELGFAIIDCLRHNDIEVILPDQVAAPLPAAVYGNVKRAKRDLEYNVRHLAQAVKAGYKIICSEPSAALCLRDDLRLFTAGKDAELVSQNTYESMSYLRDLLKQGKLKRADRAKSQKFLYHLPCHLLAYGADGACTDVLKWVCSADVKQFGAGCCGMAGTFGMQKKNYALSQKIAGKLKDALRRQPEGIVLTECAGCAMQIEHISGRIVRHPVKIIAEAYGLIRK
jgi:Fe-S oxidoreductase